MKETAPAAELQPQITGEHRELLDEVLDKWSLLVLDTLCAGPLRFNGLRRAIPAIPQKSLTASLRRLERNGMVERSIIDTRPIGVEYRISELGRTLQDLVDALLLWSTRQMAAVNRARDAFDAAQE